MKKIYRLSLHIKGCDLVFSPNLEPGEIIRQDVTLEGKSSKDFRSSLLIKYFIDLQDKLIEDTVEVKMTEIKTPRKKRKRRKKDA